MTDKASTGSFIRLLALRYSFSNKQSPLLAFISRLSMSSIVLAVALLLAVLSVMNGFERALKNDILSIVPHITLTQAEAIENWQNLAEVAKETEGVASVSAFSMLPAMLAKSERVKPALIYGLDIDDHAQLTLYRRYLTNFDWQTLKADGDVGGIIVGSGLAKKLGLVAGQSVRIINSGSAVQSAKSDSTAKHQSKLAVYTLNVIEVIHTGTELDQKLVFASLATVAGLKGFAHSEVDGLRIQVENIFDSRSIAYKVSSSTGLYFFRDWSMSQGNLYHAVQMSKKLVVLLTFIIIAVAAFNVVSSLLLSVQEKKADMAILQTMGASQQQIRRIFMLQGVVIAAAGISVGLMLGVILSLILPTIASAIESVLGFQLLNSQIYPVDFLPSELRLVDMFWVGMISFVIVLLGTLTPAWIASRQRPADILRYE